MTPLVRRAEARDLSDILEAERVLPCPWTREQVGDAIGAERTVFLVAEADGAFAGCGSFDRVLTEADVNNIAVLPDFRRRGVGAALLSRMIEICKEEGIEAVYLEVGEHNAAALGLYRRFGFREEFRRKNYYGSGGAVVMKLTLTAN